MASENQNDRELLSRLKQLVDRGESIAASARALGVEPEDLYAAAARNGYRLARRAVLEPVVPVELG